VVNFALFKIILTFNAVESKPNIMKKLLTILMLCEVCCGYAQIGQDSSSNDVETRHNRGLIVFSQAEFFISKDQKLSLYAINTKNDTMGFNAILGKFYDYAEAKSSKWWVAGVTEPADGSHLKPWVCLAKLGEDGAKPFLVDDPETVKYVTKLLNDVRNLTGAEVRKAGTE
jgi:hypothetical protein